MGEFQIGVEVGGTFTDWVVSRHGQIVRTGKVLSTPGRTEVGVMSAINDAAVSTDDLESLIHGSTVATNVVVERKGANCALVTTAGFRDVIFIQRQAKTELFNLHYRHPEPLVTRDRVYEVEEKVGPDGSVRRPLEIGCLIDELREPVQTGQIESVVVSLLHSYANPDHEKAVERALSQAFPNLYVTLSSDVLPQFREYERTSTCLMSAYTRPVVDKYLAELEQVLRKSGYTCHFSVIQANGGTVPADAIRKHAVKMVLSGPAAGVVGATAVAKQAGVHDLITFDMGGTSTDVCLVNDGQPKITTDYKIGGLPLQLPMIDIVTVGAGGGSIASVDQGGILQVGPQSAGAEPGPACYGKGGTEFTVTDANVILGYLRPQQFFGGKLELDYDAADASLDELSGRLGLNKAETASGVRQLVNFNMAQTVRLVSVERGYDPRDYTIVAYGGGGPLHAATVAEELGITRVLVPVNPGLVSAYGLLISGTQQDFMSTSISAASSADPLEFTSMFSRLSDEAYCEFASYDIDKSDVEINHLLDMRYIGQAYELTVPVDEFVNGTRPLSELEAVFHDMHDARYGYATHDRHVEIVNYRITACRHSSVTSVVQAPEERKARPPFEGTVTINGDETACTFIDRAYLKPGNSMEGPAVIEEATSTTFIPTGWTAHVDEHLHFLIEKETDCE